ncbi:MAG: glycoside hydrolase family 3 C-terminal domain-containing protein [Chloroflexi bacterium]|nr:glycoside hydrolase family 3 C-terminal domain-containing protein [Chloroflexota bacterium]
MDLSQLIGQKILLAFKAKEGPTPEIIQAFKEYQPAGLTLFRPYNVDAPAQLRALTASLQKTALDLGLPPLLIATDQEGGQLMAVGDGTPLPGNMALGATGSEELARRAGEVLGRELAAMGVNVNYAPSADVNVNPQNPVVGVRSFGEDPHEVARLSAAMIAGIQSQGVAATVKHFPGHGDTASDSHLGLPTVPHGLDRLQAVEFPPFRAAIDAGVKLVMSAHVGLPAIDGPEAPPATLSENILKGILRRDLGFDGVIVTDAMDMHAIRQGEFLGADSIRAVNAGADLLLVTADPEDHRRVHTTLSKAAQSGQLNAEELRASVERIAALKAWLSNQPVPDLSVVRCADHLRVADEIAEASITLVHDDAKLLPLNLSSEKRIAVIVPKPLDLTPADTSSYVTPQLAAAIRAYHPHVDEFIIPYALQPADITAVLERAREYDLIVIGTLNAYNQEGQTALVRELLKGQIPTIVVALRLPYDLMAFPEAKTYLCTYSILEPSMRALAKTLFGQNQARGRLPVSIPGLYQIASS